MSNCKFVAVGAVLTAGLIFASLVAANASPFSGLDEVSPRSGFTELDRAATRSVPIEVVAQKLAGNAGSSSAEPFVGERSVRLFGVLNGSAP